MLDDYGTYQIDWPADLDDRAIEIADMGILRDTTLISGGRRMPVTFYDPPRVQFAMKAFADTWHPSFAERNLVVMRSVDRATIEAAIAYMSRSDFEDLG